VELFKSMVIEQVSDGFGNGISFSTLTGGTKGITLSVRSNVVLQQPRSEFPLGPPTWLVGEILGYS